MTNTQRQLSDCMAVMHAKHSLSLVRPVESKQKLREELEAQTEAFLKKGGVVQFFEIHVDVAPTFESKLYRMNIAETEYKALNTLDAAKRWGVTRHYLHKCQKAGEPLLSRRQYGGKKEVLWSLHHLDAWAISKGLELRA